MSTTAASGEAGFCSITVASQMAADALRATRRGPLHSATLQTPRTNELAAPSQAIGVLVNRWPHTELKRHYQMWKSSRAVMRFEVAAALTVAFLTGIKECMRNVPYAHGK